MSAFIVRTPQGWYRENPGAPHDFTDDKAAATTVPRSWVEHLAFCGPGPWTMEAVDDPVFSETT